MEVQIAHSPTFHGPPWVAAGQLQARLELFAAVTAKTGHMTVGQA